MSPKQTYKKIIPGILLIVLLFAFQAAVVMAAPNIPSPTREFYVNDFANILSKDTKQFIIDKSTALEDASKAQVVVTTIDSLDGDSIENYANEMFRNYKIGSKSSDNGVLILLSVQDRKVRIEVGYGLEGAINDAKAGRIIRDLGKPYLSDEEWDKGLKAMYGAVLKEVYNEYNIKQPADIKKMDKVKNINIKIDSSKIIALLIFIFIIVSNINNRRGGGRRRRRRGFYGGGFYGGFGGGGFGGGFGGGGFGGGGGGASGGGGSSGGGGASGGF